MFVAVLVVIRSIGHFFVVQATKFQKSSDNTQATSFFFFFFWSTLTTIARLLMVECKLKKVELVIFTKRLVLLFSLSHAERSFALQWSDRFSVCVRHATWAEASQTLPTTHMAATKAAGEQWFDQAENETPLENQTQTLPRIVWRRAADLYCPIARLATRLVYRQCVVHWLLHTRSADSVQTERARHDTAVDSTRVEKHTRRIELKVALAIHTLSTTQRIGAAPATITSIPAPFVVSLVDVMWHQSNHFCRA